MTKAKKIKRTARSEETRPSSRSTGSEPKDWQCLALMAVLVVVFFHKILFGEAFFWEDFLYQNYPFRNFAATSLAMGQMPLWNPYTFNGMPFLADIQTTVLYLPSLILTLFVTHGQLDAYWLELMVILHYVAAGWGMYYLTRAFGVRRVPALFAGVAYMFSGFMITHAIHQQVVTLVAWYPLVFLLFKKALHECRWLWVFITGLVLGHSILAGFPQLSLYLYFFLFFFFLFELLTTFRTDQLVKREALSMTARAAAVVALSIAVAAVQLLPTLELSGLSQRAEITFEKSTEGSLSWGQLITLLYPKFFGSAGSAGYNYWGPGTYWYYWETCIYLGLAVLLLAVLSLYLGRNSKYVPFFWGMGIFALMFALGGNFFLQKVFFYAVPGFSTFRNPARMGIFLSFAFSILSAFSLQHIMFAERSARENSRLRNTLFVMIGIGALLWLLTASGAMESFAAFLREKQKVQQVMKTMNISLVMLVISGAAILWLIRKGATAQIGGLLLIGVLFVDVVIFGGEQSNSPIKPSVYFNRTHSLVEFIKRQKEIFRVNTRNAQGMIMDRNQGMIDRIWMMEGYTPLALQRLYPPTGSNEKTFDMLNVKYKTVTDPKSGQLDFVAHPTYFPRAFFRYRVHVAASEEELLQVLATPEFDPATTAILEETPEVQIEESSEDPKWSANITEYENNEILLNANTNIGGLLVLSEIHYPGWKAYVDGKETRVYRADYNLRSLIVPPGNHEITVRFESPAFRRGSLISLGALLIAGAGIVMGSRKKAARAGSA